MNTANSNPVTCSRNKSYKQTKHIRTAPEHHAGGFRFGSSLTPDSDRRSISSGPPPPRPLCQRRVQRRRFTLEQLEQMLDTFALEAEA